MELQETQRRDDRDMSGEPSGHELRRALRLRDAVGIGFGAIVGAGIFVITGVAAGVGGPAFLVGLLIAGAVASVNALSSAQLAAAYPRAGGTYEYGYRVLNPLAGFAAGWMFLASKITAAGAVALGLAGYIDPLIPDVSPRILAVGAIVVFTVLNSFGIRTSSRANLFIVALSVGSLVLFIAVGAQAFSVENLRPFAPAGVPGILESAAILFFAYTGYARIATLGEEVIDPGPNIPRAVLLTLGGALLLYAAVALVAVGAVGAPALAATAAPLRVAGEATGVAWLPAALSVGGVTAMLGVILSQLLGLGRMTFAMARRSDLPRWLAAVHPSRGVPVRAGLLVGAIAALIAVTGTLSQVARTASFTILVYYGIANWAALRMPSDLRLYPRFIPMAGLLSCAVLALAIEWRTVILGVTVLLTGFAALPLFRRLDGSPGG